MSGAFYDRNGFLLMAHGTPALVRELQREDSARRERMESQMAVEANTVGGPAKLPATKCTHCEEVIEGGLREYRKHIATCEKAKERKP